MVDIVKHAIRTASDWTTNQTAMEALYGVGGYYTLLSTWEADIPSDLVTDDEQWVADCYDDWSSGLVDTVDVIDRTTSATQNIVITSPDTEWHKGVIGAGFSIIKESSDYDGKNVLVIRPDYTVVEKIEVRHGTNRTAINFPCDYITIDKCIAYVSSSSSCVTAGGGTSNSSVVSNCLLYSGGSSNGIVQLYRTIGIYNCTAFNCGTGFKYNNTKASDMRNCVAYNCTTGFSINAGSSLTTCTNNADDDGTALALGIGTIDDVASTDFTDAANDDYSLASGSALIDEGTDLSTDFTDDIAGETRGTTWDIGAFEYISSGAATITAHVMHYFKQMRQ